MLHSADHYNDVRSYRDTSDVQVIVGKVVGRAESKCAWVIALGSSSFIYLLKPQLKSRTVSETWMLLHLL